LTHGATLKLFERETILNVGEMVEQLTKLSFLHMGPSLLKLLLSHIKQNYTDLSVFKKLRHLSSGGDMIPSSLLKTARALFPNIEIFVIYGSSEISCMGCTWEVPSAQQITKTFVGKPFPNTKLLLLDDNDMPTPSGAIGNLCFSGNGVINSYLNRPELNQEKFLGIKGDKYYRIGDRGRLSEGGNIELMGRADFQIQLHGLRIEPAEIEHYLKQNDQIKDAVVASRLNNTNEQILVAFVTLNNTTDLNKTELKLELGKFLPDYMLPVKYIVLEKLPLNHNFKVDRNALPQDIEQLDTEKRTGTIPISDTEKQLADIWGEVLGIEKIFLESNFLEIGGDSLLAVAMMAKVKDEMNEELYGLDVARECLAVIASKIQGFNSLASGVELSASSKPAHKNHSFYFDEDKLYGVYHPVQGTSTKSAVLVVPPLGQEAVRIHFLFKEVANSLAYKGHACLRFDFFGTGNSLGEDRDADFSVWKKNLRSALRKLSSLSGCNSVKVLASRLGANLALEEFKSDNVKLVLLDPILSGNSYYQSKVDMQQKVVSSLSFIKLFRNLSEPNLESTQQEIVGFCPNNKLVEDIKNFHMNLNALSHDTVRLLVSDSNSNLSINLSMFDDNPQLKNVTIFIGDDLHWDKFSMLENAITNQKLTNLLIESVEEFKP
ncbi:MAG: AMP-binding protein, partial [Kangiellaceae bacterium]|nr:AMP-binding protein [Kangiellaceae bacterium]